MLLCVEMALFAVLHIFAFPYKPYLKENSDPLTSSGAGYSGTGPNYQGGRFGMRAIGDAFNPWDMIKASARGFRWLFVGVRKRHADPSYHVKPDDDYGKQSQTITFAGNGEPATELSSSYQDGAVDNKYPGGRRPTFPPDDRQGLLTHAQRPGELNLPPYSQAANYSNQPSPMASSVDSENDLGDMNQQHNQYPPGYSRPPPGAGRPYPESVYEDTSYHGVQPSAPVGIPPRDVMPSSNRPLTQAQALHSELWGGAGPRPPQPHSGYDYR